MKCAFIDAAMPLYKNVTFTGIFYLIFIYQLQLITGN